MQFQHSYYNTLDAGYYVEPEKAIETPLNPVPNPDKVISTKFQPQNIGFGSNPFQHPIQGINARIREGVGYIDIPFFGAGKGNKERYTPESISKKERRDIRELAKINEVKLSTHASTNIQGLAGFGQQGFNDQQREQTLKEIKKAIDFAGDIQGGAIVFHTGEWERPFSETEWNQDTKQFENYPDEEEKTTVHMVDDRTGEVIGSVRKNTVVYEPIYKRAEKDYVDEKGNNVKQGDYIDAYNNYLNVEEEYDRLRRVPEWDGTNEEFKTQRVTWDDFVERAKEGRARGEETSPEREYMKTKMLEQQLRSKGSSLFYTQRYESNLRRRDSLKKALDFYKKLDENIPEEDKWKIMVQDSDAPDFTNMGLVPKEGKSPLQVIEEGLIEAERGLKHAHEASAAADVEARNTAERLEHITEIKNYGITRSADTIARAAEFAHQKTIQGKKRDDNFRDIFVSPESYLPNQYGSHPNEIRELIDESRDKFVEIMTKKKGMAESQAKKLAESHIRGTLDTGHFNMWRQHWKAKPGQTPEQVDAAFEQWYVKEVKDLVDSGRIGQVHLTDNMGYDDEHLTPGEGNIPVKEVMKIVEDSGIKDIVVEAGSFNATTVVGDTFSRFGSPIYSVTRGPSQNAAFGQVHQASFGYDAPPFYVVGAYSPSNEWRLWSDVQLE